MSDNSKVRTLDVRDFGAVGDGVADDFTAFVAAFAAAREQSTVEAPVAVFIPAAHYRLPQTINVKGVETSPRDKPEGSTGASG